MPRPRGELRRSHVVGYDPRLIVGAFCTGCESHHRASSEQPKPREAAAPGDVPACGKRHEVSLKVFENLVFVVGHVGFVSSTFR